MKKLSRDPNAKTIIQNELARTGTIEQILSSGMPPEISWGISSMITILKPMFPLNSPLRIRAGVLERW
jgi:hypothetical protein